MRFFKFISFNVNNGKNPDMLGCHQDLSEGFDESFTNFSVITSLTIYFLDYL